MPENPYQPPKEILPWRYPRWLELAIIGLLVLAAIYLWIVDHHPPSYLMPWVYPGYQR
jgi:hypothetical protein